MASIVNRPNGHRWIQFVDHQEKRKTLRLGKTNKKHAEEVCRRVESLLAAKIAGDSIDRQTAKWLETTEGKIRVRLAALGLAEAARERRSLGQWLTEFKDRNKSWKKSSIENFNATKDCLIEHFTESRMLDSIKPHDAEDFRMWMLTEKFNRQTGKPGLADDTVRRRCGRSKSIFKEAIKRGYCLKNPFESIVSFTRGNAKRQFFVESSVAYDCIEASPCNDWRTIIALCRFGGLRCPTEIVNLDWVDVNLPEGFMILRQPKVEHHDGGGIRLCPIFPELRPYLEAAWDAAPEGAVHVINRYRRHDQNWARPLRRSLSERATSHGLDCSKTCVPREKRNYLPSFRPRTSPNGSETVSRWR